MAKEKIKKAPKKQIDKKQLIIVVLAVICLISIIVLSILTEPAKNKTNLENIKEISINNNQIEPFILGDLYFVATNSAGQLTVKVTNKSDNELNIKSFIIKITGKSGTTDIVEIEYNQVLLGQNETNMTLGYDINNIQKISFEVIYAE